MTLMIFQGLMSPIISVHLEQTCLSYMTVLENFKELLLGMQLEQSLDTQKLQVSVAVGLLGTGLIF